MEDETRLRAHRALNNAEDATAVRPLLTDADPPPPLSSQTTPTEDRHKISNTEAILHLVKATIGGGFLAMPNAFVHAGLLVGSLGTVLIGLAVLNMMSSIVRISQALRSGLYVDAALGSTEHKDGGGNANNKTRLQNSRRLILPPMDYPETVASVFERGASGRFSRWARFAKHFTSASLVITYYGVNIIYVCIVAETLKQFIDEITEQEAGSWWADSLHDLSLRWYPTVAAFLIVPVGMVRLMKYMVPFSAMANTCLVMGAMAVFYFIFFQDNGSAAIGAGNKARLIVWPVSEWTVFAGSALCSMEGVGMLLHIENVMENPLGLAGPPSYTLHKSMFVIIFANALMGLIGYSTYGDFCKGSIALNLPENNAISSIIKGVIAAGILLTYGLQLTVTADLSWKALVKIFSAEVIGHGGNKLTEFYYNTMRLLLIGGTIIMATVVPNIGPLVSLVGSVGFSVLGLIIPIIMETIWYWEPKDELNGGWDVADAEFVGIRVAVSPGAIRRLRRRRTTWRILRHAKNVVLLVLAVCSLVGGTYFNVRDLVNGMNDGDKNAPAHR